MSICQSLIALPCGPQFLGCSGFSVALTTLPMPEEILGSHLPVEQQFPYFHNLNLPHQAAAVSARTVEYLLCEGFSMS